MALPTSISELESRPGFSELSYGAQQQVRSQWAQEVLFNDPEFLALDPNEKEYVAHELITRPPVFGSGRSEYVRNTVRIAEGVRHGRTEAEKESGWRLLREGAFRRLGPISKGIVDFSLSLLAPMTDVKGGSDLEDFVTTSDDERKAYEYLKFNMMNNPDTRPKIHLETVGTIGGTFADLGVNWLLLKGVGAAAGAAGVGALGGSTGAAAQTTAGRMLRTVFMQSTPKFTASGGTLANAGKFGRYLHQTLIPFTTMASRDAIIGVTQEYAQDKYEGRDWKEMGFGEQAGNAAAAFGQWFAADMLFFGALQVGRAFLGNAAHVFRRGGLRGKKTPLDDMNQREVLDYALNEWVLGKKPVPAAIWDTLSDGQKGVITRARANITVGQHIDNYVPGSDEWNKAFGLARGADIIQEGNKWKAKSVIDGSDIGTFASSKSALKASIRKLDNQFEEVVNKTDEAVRAGFASDVVLKQNIKGTLKDIELDERQVIRMFHPDVDSGRVSTGKIKAALRNVARQQGASDDVVNSIEVKALSPNDYWKKGAAAREGNTYFVPRTVRTPAEHTQYFKRTLNALDDQLGAPQRGGATTGTRPLQRRFPSEIETAGYSPALAGYMAKNLYPGSKIVRGGGKQMKIVLRNGDELTFATNREMGEFLYRKTITEVRPFTELELRQFLKHEHGIQLKQVGSPDGTIRYKAVRGNKVIAEGDFRSASEFIENAGRITDAEGNVLHIADETLRPKLPVDLAPMASVIDNNLDEVVVQGAVVRGPMSKIYELSENFRDYNRIGRLKTIKSGEHIPKVGTGATYSEAAKRSANPGSSITLDVRSKEWEVFLPEFNYRKTFASIKDARAWIAKAKDAPNEIADIALEKGARVSFAHGQFMVQHVDPNVGMKVARNTEELKQIIRGFPDTPKEMRELSGLSDATVQSFREEFADILPHPESMPKFFRDQDFLNHVKKTRPSKASKVYMSSLYRPAEAQFKEMANYFGRPDLYENVYRGTVKGAEATRAATGRLDGQINAFFRDVPEARRKILSAFMELDPKRWDDFAAKLDGFELTQADRNTINRTREFLTEFGRTWGVDPWKFLNDYLPRLRRYVMSPKFNPGDNGYDVMRKALGMKRNLPKELDFFAKHLRGADIEAIASEWDLREIVRMYTHTAVKRELMGESLETAKRWLNENLDVFQGGDERMMVMATSFVQRMSGMQMTSVMEETLRGMSSEFAQTFASAMNKHGLKSMAGLAPAMEDMVSFMQTLSVGSLMAFRPYLPIRNMQQIWTTLAPRVGNETVVEASKRVAKKPAEAMQDLVDNGLVTHRTPIMNVIGGGSRNTFLHKFTESGMVHFRNSDDYTRAIAAKSVDLLVDDAGVRYLNKAIDEKQFLKLSSIDVLDPMDQKFILNTLNEKGLGEAKREFKRILINETMFPYRHAENPEVFQMVAGRVFGHFGHYSVNFLENVRRMLRYNPAKTIGTLALNSTALVFAFEKVMGISAYSFRPLNQMFFTGGPMYTAFNNTLTTLGGGWQATRLAGKDPQDRAKFIWEQWSRILVPGSMRLYNARRAAEFIADGNYYEGIMRFLSFPMIDPNLKE